MTRPAKRNPKARLFAERRATIQRMLREDDGALSFEWVLLATLLTIGIVSGLAGARDAIIDELGDVAQAALSFDQSYSFEGIPGLGIPSSEFVDPNDPLDPDVYSDCVRSGP